MADRAGNCLAIFYDSKEKVMTAKKKAFNQRNMISGHFGYTILGFS